MCAGLLVWIHFHLFAHGERETGTREANGNVGTLIKSFDHLAKMLHHQANKQIFWFKRRLFVVVTIRLNSVSVLKFIFVLYPSSCEWKKKCFCIKNRFCFSGEPKTITIFQRSTRSQFSKWKNVRFLIWKLSTVTIKCRIFFF